MMIEYDPAKRLWTLQHRSLEFDDAAKVFEGATLQRLDDRRDYGEDRFIGVGALGLTVVVLVWTPRGDARRIISMRIAHDHEREAYRLAADRSG